VPGAPGVIPPGAGIPSGTEGVGVTCPEFGVSGFGTAPGLLGPIAIGGGRGAMRGVPGGGIIGGAPGGPMGVGT